MAVKILDGSLNHDQYQYSRNYPGQGGTIYFNTYQTYNRTVNQPGVLDSGTLNTYLLVKKDDGPFGAPDGWYKAARLGENGQWIPLTQKESGILVPGENLGDPGTFQPIPNASNSPILGPAVVRDLNAGGTDSLRYQAINNAKFQLKKAGGLTDQQVANEFLISNNINSPQAIQPDPKIPSLFGDPVAASQTTPGSGGNNNNNDNNNTNNNNPNANNPPFEEPGSGADESSALKIAPAEGLRYPIDIAKTKQDRIEFTAQYFMQRNLTANGLKTTFSPASFSDLKGEGKVYIAIQAPISDQNSVEWNSGTASPLEASLFHLSYNIMKSNNPGAVVSQTAADILGVAGQKVPLIQKLLAGQAASLNNVMARTDNLALNSNLELLFTGPQLRSFNFQFKMSARSQKEADEIKKIIKFFKYHMSVRKGDTLFLKAPRAFKIEYKTGGESTLHPGIGRIKTCALQNFGVDYTPLGSYATYEDGTMVSYTLNMQFQEILPIYDGDYTTADTIGL